MSLIIISFLTSFNNEFQLLKKEDATIFNSKVLFLLISKICNNHFFQILDCTWKIGFILLEKYEKFSNFYNFPLFCLIIWILSGFVRVSVCDAFATKKYKIFKKKKKILFLQLCFQSFYRYRNERKSKLSEKGLRSSIWNEWIHIKLFLSVWKNTSFKTYRWMNLFSYFKETSY